MFKYFFTKKNFINILFSTLPLSFIAGNPAINLNILMLSFATLFFYKTEVFKFKALLIDKLIVVFFIFSFIPIAINGFENFFLQNYNFNTEVFYKTIFFLRYLFLYCTIRFLLESEKINLKLFYITSSFSVLFVCCDIFYQFYHGVDIFGYEIIHYKLSGPFGAELIAGSYLQRFSLFFFLALILYFERKRNFVKDGIVLFAVIFVFTSIIISANRMPTLLFILTVFLSILYLIPKRKYLLIIPLLLPLILIFLVNTNVRLAQSFGGLYNQFENTAYNLFFDKEEFTTREIPEHIWHFKSGVDTWAMNKIAGDGIKSFRTNCWEALKINNSTWSCATHPHNYYIEILADLGVVGVLIFLFIFFQIILIFYNYQKKHSHFIKHDYLLKVVFLLIFVELLPIKSSGSFFSTFNAAYIFLILSIFVAIISKSNKKI